MAVSKNPIAQPWFSTPFFPKLLQSASLTNAEMVEIQHFAENGYLIFDPEIEDIDKFAHDLLHDVPYPIREGKNWNRVQDHWRHNASVRQLAIFPNVLRKLEFLYQRKPIPFQTLNFPVGTEQPTHSDTIHFNSMPERWMCGVWIALEDIDENNGPLHYYPGSHRLPIYSMHDFGLSPQDYDDLSESYPLYERLVADMLAATEFKRVEVKLKKGQALIWEANLFHGGSAIRDPDRTRLSQVTHYFFEGCSYYGPLQSDVPLGKVVWRHVENIAERQPVQHMYNGRQAEAPMFDGSSQMLRLATEQAPVAPECSEPEAIVVAPHSMETELGPLASEPICQEGVAAAPDTNELATEARRRAMFRRPSFLGRRARANGAGK